MVLTTGTLILVWASVIGFAAALALVVTLALPPLLVPETDVPRFSAAPSRSGYAHVVRGPAGRRRRLGRHGLGRRRPSSRWPPGGVGMVALAAGTDLRGRP